MQIEHLNEHEAADLLFAMPVDIVRLEAMARELVGSEPSEDDFALMAMQCAKPGHILTLEDATRFTKLLLHWAPLAWTNKEAEIAAAFAEARRLMDELGDDHDETLRAVIKAVELRDPGCCDRMAKECGINLPSPTHYSASDEPLYSSEAIADALGVPHQEIVDRIKAMAADAPFPGSAAAAHQVQ